MSSQQYIKYFKATCFVESGFENKVRGNVFFNCYSKPAAVFLDVVSAGEIFNKQIFNFACLLDKSLAFDISQR